MFQAIIYALDISQWKAQPASHKGTVKILGICWKWASDFCRGKSLSSS